MPKLFKQLQRRELFAPLDPPDVRKVYSASDSPGQLPLRQPLPEPEAPETLSKNSL
jgi:hypothetical protein